MSRPDINALHGAALRRAFDEACITRGGDPAHHYSGAVESLFGSTAEEFARERGSDWYYQLDAQCQGLHDITLRQAIRGLERVDLCVTEGVAEVLQHELLTARERKEQMDALTREAGR